MTTVVAFLFVFGLLTIFHELGHFLMAKKAGILVEEFGVGLGPKLWSQQRGETMYSIRLFPLGGFVKMLGEEDSSENDDARSFHRQPPAKRLLVIGAGPFMNFILAALLFALIFFMVGVPVKQAEIGAVIPDSPAHHAGIESGDEIIAIEDSKIEAWTEIIPAISPRAGKPTNVTIKRNEQIFTVILTPELVDDGEQRGVIGIERAMKEHLPWASLYWGARQTLGTTIFILDRVVEMIVQRQATDVSGPVGIVQAVGEVARTGFVNVLSLAAILSVNLGLFNLFPIPMLDGGQLILISWEGIRGKRLGPEQEGAIRLIGVLLLLALLAMATYQDLRRLGLGV